MYGRVYLIIKNKFWNMSTEEIILRIFNENKLISAIAKEELLTRNLNNLNVSNYILKQIITKLSIEQIYQLITEHQGSRLAELAEEEFDKILEDAINNYPEAYFAKVNEGKRPKLTLLK